MLFYWMEMTMIYLEVRHLTLHILEWRQLTHFLYGPGLTPAMSTYNSHPIHSLGCFVEPVASF